MSSSDDVFMTETARSRFLPDILRQNGYDIRLPTGQDDPTIV